jgi:hypothetical protein
MNQSKANQWIRVLLMVLEARLRALRGAPYPIRADVGEAPGGGRGVRPPHGRAGTWTLDPSRSAWGGTRTGTRLPPFGYDGTERCSERPQDPAEHRHCYSGKKTCHTVNNVLLINAMLTILLLSGPLC